MACGCPVVFTNIAGLVDLPTLQAEPLSSDICDKLKYLLNNYQKIKEDQKKKVREIFHQDNWSDAWLRVIKNTKE